VIRIGIAGAAGRMGKMLLEAVSLSENGKLAAATVEPGSTLIGADAGEMAGLGVMEVALSADLHTVIDDIDGGDMRGTRGARGNPKSCSDLRQCRQRAGGRHYRVYG